MTGQPASGPTGAPRRSRPGVLLLWLLVPVVAGIAVASLALIEIGRQLDSVRTAQSDNTTWLVAQLEVDLLNHAVALAAARSATPEMRAASLQEVRRSFDVLYSRAMILDRRASQGDTAPGFEAGLMATVRSMVNVIDSPDSALAQGLPDLSARIEAQRAPARTFVVNSLQDLLVEGDRRRNDLRLLLQGFTVVGVMLVVFLSTAVGAMLFMYRTARRRALEGERISSNLRSVIEASLDAMIVADAEGRVQHYNSAAARMFGRARDAVAGLPLADLRLVEDLTAARIAKLLRGSDQKAAAARQTLTGLRADGARFPVEGSFARDLDSEGRVMLMAFLRDVSAEREAEAALLRARDEALEGARAKSRFLAVMSHEMRTPLNGTIASIDILEAESGFTDRQRRFLAVARQSSEMALEQIDDVLEITRLDAGATASPAVTFDLVQLLGDIVGQNRPLASARGNTLSADLSALGPEARHLRGHRRLLSRVAVNLLGNAIKFTEGGQVQLRASLVPCGDAAALLRVEVTDTGPGIAEDQQEAIFEDFRTLDASDTRRSGGTGLGLGIARRAVQQMDGRIWLQSRLGAGATFSFEVPIEIAEAPAEARAAASAAAVPAVEPLDVLIAEDNDINRTVLREMLQVLGHRVTATVNGLEAVDAARDHCFDMVILDVAMPVMGGVEAAAHIRAGGASSAARIVALTAHAQPDTLSQIAASGLEAVEIKPVTFAKLRAMLGQVPPRAHALQPAPATQVAPAEPALDNAVMTELAALLGGAAALGVIDHVLAELEALDLGAATAQASQLHRVAGSAALVGAVALQKALIRAEDALHRGQPIDPEALSAARRDARAALQATRQQMEQRAQ